MQKNNISKKGFSLVFCSVLIFNIFVSIGYSEDLPINKKYPILKSNYLDTTGLEYTYYQYLSEVKDNKDTEGCEISIDIAKFNDNTKSKYIRDYEGRKSFIWDKDDLKSAEWSFEVANEGCYNIKISYEALKGSVLAPKRNVLIDGKTIFRELKNVEFQRMWKDENKPYKNLLGDEVNPKQSEVTGWQDYRLSDYQGSYEEPFKIYFSKGIHTFGLEYVAEAMAISSITLLSPDQINDYKIIETEYASKGYKPATIDVKIDAENSNIKSDSSVRLEYSSDPMADPKPEVNRILNVLGGTNWNLPNQSVTWVAEAPEDGLYKIDLRVYQKYTDGLPVYRQILVDDKVPFKEFLSYKFEFADWKTITLSGPDKKPYLVYLTKGKHTLKMVAINSEYRNILYELSKSLDVLSKSIQNIVMITSISPDPNFDYKLDKKIPNLLEDFTAARNIIDSQIIELKQFANKNPGAVNSLSKITYDLNRMLKDPFIIARNLSQLTDAQTNLSLWITQFKNLPLQLDYIIVGNPQKPADDYRSNFFQILYSVLRNYVVSYYKDYDLISGDNSSDSTKKLDTLNIWISRGKDWSEVLKRLSDEDFTKKYNTVANLNILPPGQLGTSGVLMMAIASGNAPDIAIGVDNLMPSEYGMRDQVQDLKQFSDYEQVSKLFLPGCLRPYTFKGAVYGIPEAIDFSVLYYRKDILSTLNLPLPNSWDDILNVDIPVLKKNGMDFWYEGGLNLFLYQNGGELYKDDGLKSGLDTSEAYNAFKAFTNLYKLYEVPVAANFYSRFRIGQMPLGISSFATYLTLQYAAPELQDKWGVALLPGTVQADGTINRTNSGNTSGCVIFNQSKKKELSWDFLKWYTSTEIQTRYTNELISYIGRQARWFSANTEAFDNSMTDSKLSSIIKEQRKYYKDPFNVIGGYFTARQVENARIRVVVDNMNYREALEISVKDINRELEIKNEEFKIRAQSAKK